jgi:phosphatidylglycerol:prolipoprotein diacylglycerol transferase
MAFYGAVFGGALAALIACRIKKLSFLLVLDGATILIPIAQTFGRIGNIVNGDILGYQSNLPWATQYINSNNTFVPSHDVAFQPAAAYELLFSLALFLAIYALRFRFSIPGTLFVVWAVTYSVGQFFLFFLRDNPVVLLGLKQAQLTAIVVVAVVLYAWLYWRRLYKSRGRERESHPADTLPNPIPVGASEANR